MDIALLTRSIVAYESNPGSYLLVYLPRGYVLMYTQVFIVAAIDSTRYELARDAFTFATHLALPVVRVVSCRYP